MKTKSLKTKKPLVDKYIKWANKNTNKTHRKTKVKLNKA